MLAKCTNPSCSALFSHLAEGRLFLLETEPPLGLWDYARLKQQDAKFRDCPHDGGSAA